MVGNMDLLAYVMVGLFFAVLLWSVRDTRRTSEAVRDASEWHQEGVVEALDRIVEAMAALNDMAGVRDTLDTLSAQQLDLFAKVQRLDEGLDALPHKWDEMYARVRRTEERARGSVRRAMEELEDAGLRSGELEGTLEEIRQLYGDRGEEGGVRPVRPGMEPGANGDVSAPDPETELIRARNARVFGG